jgi:hypothetical protein
MWDAYVKAKLKPLNIPSKPDRVYKNAGWKGIGDFLGNNHIPSKDRNYKSFQEVRIYLKENNIKSGREWKLFIQENKVPNDIPKHIDLVFKNKGWNGWRDFLGSDNLSNSTEDKFLNYHEARDYAIKNNLKSTNEWRLHCKSGKMPYNIPKTPYLKYKDNGWISWGEFLGTGKVADNFKIYKSFDEVKKFVSKLNLKSKTEWACYCKSGKKPIDIPSNVSTTYKNEWKNWADFLGKT